MRITERVPYILLIQSENSHIHSIPIEIHPHYRTALRLHYKIFSRNYSIPSPCNTGSYT